MSTNARVDPTLVRDRNHWQDWVNLVLAIWLFVSPWVLNLAGVIDGSTGAGATANSPGMAAAWNAWVIGVVVGVIAVAALSRLQQWEEVINMLFGIWLFIAPWVLGFTTLSVAAWDHWIVGALIFLIAACDVATMSRMAGSPARVSYR